MASTDAPAPGPLRAVGQRARGALRITRQPPLKVAVVLPRSAGAERLTAVLPTVAAQRARHAVAAVVVEHAQELGVPVRPDVSVRRSADPLAVPHVEVAGRSVRVLPAELDVAVAAGNLPSAGRGDEPAALARTAALAVQVAIEHDPSVLLGPAQLTALIARARAAGLTEPADDVLGAALRRVIAHGFGLHDLGALREPFGQQAGLTHTAGELAEVAMDALGGPSLEIRLSEPTLREATLRGMRRQAFVDMRKRLFRDLGVVFPDVAVIVDPKVPELAAVVRLNRVRYATRPLAGPGVEFIVDLLEQRLRLHPSWFVALAEVRRTVEELRLAVPELVAAFRDPYGEPQLSLFTRTFVQERVPVRNAARLMVLVLDALPPSTGRDQVRLVEPSRMPGERLHGPGARGLVSYVRQQMNEEAAGSWPGLVSVSHTRLPTDLDAALDAVRISDVGADLEPAPADLKRLTGLAERLLAQIPAIDGERPTLVTATHHSRTVASRLLAFQYPEIAVVAAEEYPLTHRLAPINASPVA